MITGFYAALGAIFYAALTFYVIHGRGLHKAAVGDGGQEDLSRRIRIHANFAEYAPLFFILLMLAERQELWGWMVHVLGVLFLTGRALHAYGVGWYEIHGTHQGRAILRYRQAGMILTLCCILSLSGILMIQFIV